MGQGLTRRALLQAAAGAVTTTCLMGLGAGKASAGPNVFYVAAGGDDEADGTSPATAWATIQKANATLESGSSTLLFRRGDTFYGELAPPYGCEVGAFGNGPRPILSMFKLMNDPSAWIEHADGLWKIDLGSPDTHEGYTATTDANIGYLEIDSTVKPSLKFDLADLERQWDFFCDIPNNILFVRSDANPTAKAQMIKAAPNGNLFGISGRVVSCNAGGNALHDLHITGSGGCGIGGTGPDVIIRDCTIDYIGGSELRDGTKRRYGNAIDNGVGTERWLIEHNEIAQVYDVAWSPQGNAGRNGYWRDLTARSNYIHDCGQTFEFWSTGSKDAPGFERVLVKGNRCERAGQSVFSEFRPDQAVRVHLLTYHLETPVDITIEGNIFDSAHGAYSYHATEPPKGLVTRYNWIRLNAGQKIQYQRENTVEQVVEWRSTTGREIGSTFEIVSKSG